MRAIVFCNGNIENYGVLARILRADDYLIGADGGTRHCIALGRLPHVIVGDLDSIEPHLLDELTNAGVLVERHPPVKDQTDLELAIERGLADGADEILLVGATGGRLDQTLANLLIPAQRLWPAPVKLMQDNQIAQLLRGPDVLVLDGAAGDTVSLIPLSETVTGISYSGLEYPLERASLHIGSTRGVSNAMTGASATIEVETGMALVVHSV